MELIAKDSLSYSGSPVEFVDGDHFVHVVGGGLRVASNTNGKASDFIFTDAVRGISCFGTSHRARSIAVAKRSKPPSIDVFDWPSKNLKCRASGVAELQYGAVALSRLGERMAAVSQLVDKKLAVWDIPNASPPSGEVPSAVLLAEAELPVPCTMLAFNPADSTMIATACPNGGLFFWKLARSHGTWQLSCVEADCGSLPAPALPDKEAETERSMSDDGATAEDGDEEASLVETNSFKAHIGALVWGLNNEVYAGNLQGVIGRFDANSGNLLGSHNQGAQNGQQPTQVVGLIYTKQYLVVGTVGKIVYWLKCPEFDGVDHTATIFGITDGTPPENIATLACSPTFTKFVVGTVQGTLHTHRLDTPAEPSGMPDILPTIGEFPNGFTLASTALTVPKSKADLVAVGGTDGSLRLFWASSSTPAAIRIYRSEGPPMVADDGEAQHLEPTSPAERSVTSNAASLTSNTSPKAGTPLAVEPTSTKGSEKGFNAPEMSLTDAEALAQDEQMDPLSLPCVAITCLAALPGHPVLAVGLASGQLSLVYVHQEEKSVTMLPLDLKTLDREPLTHLSFSTPLGSASALLAVVCAAEGKIYVIETSHAAANFEVVAVIVLASDVQVFSIAWAENDILLVAGKNGFFATYAIPKPEEKGDASAVACSPLEPLALQSISSMAGQAAAKSGGYSAMISAAGGFFQCCPGIKGLVVNGALPDRETLESNAKLSDAGTTPSLNIKMKRVVQGHQRGISCAALSSSGDLIATGGVDGLVVLWKLGKGTASKIAAAQLHSAPVISISFVRSDTFLVSVGLDKSSLVSQIKNGKPFVSKKDTAIAFLANARKRTASGISIPSTQILPTDEPSSEQEVTEPVMIDLKGPLPAIGKVPTFMEQFGSTAVKAEILDTAEKVADTPSKDMSKILVFKDRLRQLLEENERATDLERMDRSEFVVDVARRDTTIAENKKKAEEVRRKIKDADAVKDLISARIIADCWDSMEVPASEVRAMQVPHTSVTNMPIVKQSTETEQTLEKCKRIRLMELKEMQLAGAYDNVWPGRRNEVPSNVSWIINEGALAPVIDVISNIKSTVAPAGGEGGGDAAADGAGAVASGSGGAEDGEEDIDTGKKMKIDTESILTYLYPPTALKTPNQKRMQIVYLNELIRQMTKAYNKHFDKLHGSKQDVMERIEEKNARIREIIAELQISEDYFVPTLAPTEKPESFLTVSDSELSCKPYESEAMKKAKAEEEAEKARRDAEAKKDNIGERALQDMMYGTLETKKEGVLEKQLDPMPEWMSTLISETYEGDAEAAVANMEPDQVKEYEDYEAKKAAFEESRRAATKALEQELKRLKTEVADVAKSFDESVGNLSRKRVQVQIAICTQELYMLRVGLGLMESEEQLVTKARLEAKLTSLLETKDELDEQSARWTVKVEAMKEQLTELQESDRALERDFKRSVVEPAVDAVNQEQLRHLLSLFRLRKTAAMRPGSQGSRASGSRASRGSLRRSSVAQGSGRRSLADAAAGLMGARRSSRNSAERRSSGSLGVMGSLQRAMAEAREAAAAENDPFRESDKKAERAKALSEQMGAANEVGVPTLKNIDIPPLDMETDCPENFRCEDLVWDRLNELRTQKIQSERAVKAVQAQYNDMKKQSDAIQLRDEAIEKEVADVQSQISALDDKLYMSDRNLEIMVQIKQGQNELLQDGVVTDYSDGVLIPQKMVEDLNDQIKALGAEKVRILHKIKNFRKSINYMQWEENYIKMKERDLEEFYTDLLLLRVEKKTLAIMRGEVGLNETDVAVRGEQRMALLKRMHLDKHAKISQVNSKISASIRDRRAENERLKGQLRELEASVKARESIYRSRLDGGGEMSAQQKAQKRMKRVTMRRRLIDLGRVQTEEIDFLRQELDRLRQRTFPSFAHAARHRLLLPPDEIV